MQLTQINWVKVDEDEPNPNSFYLVYSSELPYHYFICMWGRESGWRQQGTGNQIPGVIAFAELHESLLPIDYGEGDQVVVNKNAPGEYVGMKGTVMRITPSIVKVRISGRALEKGDMNFYRHEVDLSTGEK